MGKKLHQLLWCSVISCPSIAAGVKMMTNQVPSGPSNCAGFKTALMFQGALNTHRFIRQLLELPSNSAGSSSGGRGQIPKYVYFERMDIWDAVNGNTKNLNLENGPNWYSGKNIEFKILDEKCNVIRDDLQITMRLGLYSADGTYSEVPADNVNFVAAQGNIGDSIKGNVPNKHKIIFDRPSTGVKIDRKEMMMMENGKYTTGKFMIMPNSYKENPKPTFTFRFEFNDYSDGNLMRKSFWNPDIQMYPMSKLSTAKHRSPPLGYIHVRDETLMVPQKFQLPPTLNIVPPLPPQASTSLQQATAGENLLSLPVATAVVATIPPVVDTDQMGPNAGTISAAQALTSLAEQQPAGGQAGAAETGAPAAAAGRKRPRDALTYYEYDPTLGLVEVLD